MNIVPTVGRKIWYRPVEVERNYGGDAPFDATVVYVHNPQLVNLIVRNEFGVQFSRTSVRVCETYDQCLEDQCGWMPYQAGQAKAQATVLSTGIETKHYADGSSATGTPPLPDRSPAEQEADARGAQSPSEPLPGAA